MSEKSRRLEMELEAYYAKEEEEDRKLHGIPYEVIIMFTAGEEKDHIKSNCSLEVPLREKARELGIKIRGRVFAKEGLGHRRGDGNVSYTFSVDLDDIHRFDALVKATWPNAVCLMAGMFRLQDDCGGDRFGNRFPGRIHGCYYHLYPIELDLSPESPGLKSRNRGQGGGVMKKPIATALFWIGAFISNGASMLIHEFHVTRFKLEIVGSIGFVIFLIGCWIHGMIWLDGLFTRLRQDKEVR